MGPNLKGHRNIPRSVLTKYSPSLWRVTTGGAGATKKRSIETALFVFIICGAEGEKCCKGLFDVGLQLTDVQNKAKYGRICSLFVARKRRKRPSISGGLLFYPFAK